MAAMSITQRLLQRLRSLNGPPWRESCAAGAPVPDPGGCAGVDCDSVPLSELPLGGRGVISCLQHPGSRSGGRLAAMGVLPGVEIELVQRYPAFVFRLGFSEFAVDEGMAGHIRVHPHVR